MELVAPVPGPPATTGRLEGGSCCHAGSVDVLPRAIARMMFSPVVARCELPPRLYVVTRPGVLSALDNAIARHRLTGFVGLCQERTLQRSIFG